MIVTQGNSAADCEFCCTTVMVLGANSIIDRYQCGYALLGDSWLESQLPTPIIIAPSISALAKLP